MDNYGDCNMCLFPFSSGKDFVQFTSEVPQAAPDRDK